MLLQRTLGRTIYSYFKVHVEYEGAQLNVSPEVLDQDMSKLIIVEPLQIFISLINVSPIFITHGCIKLLHSSYETLY